VRITVQTCHPETRGGPHGRVPVRRPGAAL